MIQIRTGNLHDNTLLYKTVFLPSALTAQLFSKPLEQIRMKQFTSFSLDKLSQSCSAKQMLLVHAAGLCGRTVLWSRDFRELHRESEKVLG